MKKPSWSWRSIIFGIVSVVAAVGLTWLGIQIFYDTPEHRNEKLLTFCATVGAYLVFIWSEIKCKKQEERNHTLNQQLLSINTVQQQQNVGVTQNVNLSLENLLQPAKQLTDQLQEIIVRVGVAPKQREHLIDFHKILTDLQSEISQRKSIYDYLQSNIEMAKGAIFDAYEQYMRTSNEAAALTANDSFKKNIINDTWVFLSEWVYESILYGELPLNLPTREKDTRHIKRIAEIIQSDYLQEIVPIEERQQKVLSDTITQIASRL